MARKTEQEGQKEHYAATHDIPKATIGEIKSHIELSWKYKQHRGAIIVVGEAGVGKSQIVAQVAKDNEARVYDIRTAHYGLVGAGIPSTKDSPKGFFDIVVPSVFPKPGEKSIMLFEEINQGLQHAISMFFSLVEDRRMFNYTLPDDSLVVALMNPATAMYAVQSIENNAALRRRLKWLYAIDSFGDWYRHAKTKRFHETDHICLNGEDKPCHPMILGFLQNYPNNLYDKNAQLQGKQYMCPATAQTVSLDAYVLDMEGIPLSDSFSLTRFAASIGEHMATALVEYIKDNYTAVKAEDVVCHYLEKGRKPVKRLLEKSEHEKVTELNVNVLTYIFGIQPEVEDVATNFVSYLGDLPKEMRMEILSQLKKYADDNGATQYLFMLMREVQDQPGWHDLHTEIDSAQSNVEEQLGS